MRKQILIFITTVSLLLNVNVANAQDDILNTIIEIVSPVESAALIKQVGVSYNNQLLNNPAKYTAYQTDIKKALNLGIYSTDLGYATINEQNAEALSFLNAVKKTAEGISLKDGTNLGRFIDFNKILSLGANRQNLNKLLEETSNTFESMSLALERENRSDLAALILTGGWLETLHITCQVALTNPNQALDERVVQQKLILEKLMPVLSQFTGQSEYINGIYGDLSKLNQIYSKYTFGETASTSSTTTTEGGIEVLSVSGEADTSDVSLSKEDLQNISNLVSQIRAEVTR